MDRDQLGEWLSAYLDGELDEQDTSRVESVLEADSGAREMLEELREMSAAVGALPRQNAPDSLEDDFPAALALFGSVKRLFKEAKRKCTRPTAPWCGVTNNVSTGSKWTR